MPADKLFVTEDLSYAKLVELADKQNISNAAFNGLLWGLLGTTLGTTERHFSYGATLAAADPGCAPHFARSFVHIDWIDGESIVQAEETSLEDGFNKRFHRIETDFDAMAADVRQLFNCLAALRAQLAARLEEIKTELNAINGDIAACCKKDSGTPVYNPPVQYPYPWITAVDPGYYKPQVPGYDPYGPVINPGNYRVPGYAPDYTKPWSSDPVNPFDINAANEFDQSSVTRSTRDPNVAIVAGMRARRIEAGTFNGKQVEVWSTPAGIVMTPLDTRGAAAGTRVGWTNPTVSSTAEFVGWAQANDKRVTEGLGQRGFTVAQFNQKFGDERLASGATVGSFLSQLPSGAMLKSAKQAGALVVDQATASIVRDQTASETVIGLVGLMPGDQAVEKAQVATLKSVPDAVGKGLAKIGITTVGQLAKADPQQLATKLRDAGVSASIADTTGWAVQAQMLQGLAGK